MSGTAALRAEVLVEGHAEGELLRLDAPISFWGGVDPRRGTVTDPRHPQYRHSVSGRILALERSIGSSSGSSVLLELLRCGIGPAGIVLAETDAILTLAAIVAREMGYGAVPIFRLDHEQILGLTGRLRLERDGRVVPLT